MTIVKDAGRQTTLQGIFKFTYADLTEDAAHEVIDLPHGAVALDGELVITEAFDSTTSDTIAVSGVATLAATDVQSTGRTAFTAVGNGTPLTSPDTLDITWDAGTNGTATQGAGYVRVSYVIDNRATEVQ